MTGVALPLSPSLTPMGPGAGARHGRQGSASLVRLVQEVRCATGHQAKRRANSACRMMLTLEAHSDAQPTVDYTREEADGTWVHSVANTLDCSIRRIGQPGHFFDFPKYCRRRSKTEQFRRAKSERL